MLRVIVPAAILVFILASFAFFDGWPFRSRHEDQPPSLSRTESTNPDPSPEGHVGPGVPVEAETVAERRREDEAARARAKADREQQESLERLRKEDPTGYRRFLSARVLDHARPWSERKPLLDELRSRTRAEVFHVPSQLPSTLERVQGGDNLTRIARRVKKASGGNVTSALIMRINGLSSDRIRAGANLAVPTGTMTVRVHKSDFRLFLVMDGEIILDFAVGTGKSDSTPVGDFEIQGKTKNPTWTRPDGSVVPSGHPDHIIGTRWLGFANAQGGTGFGIHGTVDDSSIGKAMSEGCVRMKNREVEELFELVPEGCRVEVRP